MQQLDLSGVNNIYIIGCGGVASYLLPILTKVLISVEDKPRIHLIDGDILEERNLDRQLFDPDYIGMHKSVAMAEMIRDSYVPDKLVVEEQYFTDGMEVEPGSLILCCVDNHAARKAVLATADRTLSTVIIGGNEYTDAQAIYYEFGWSGTALDPRVRYPEILTDDRDDPTRIATGCTGLVQTVTPQLALANESAANHMMWLMWFWFAEVSGLDDGIREVFPIEHSNSFSKFRTMTIGDAVKQAKEKGVLEAV
jgi:hypothetical protein